MTISSDPEYQKWLASRKRPSHRPERKLTYKGKTHTLNEWAQILGIKPYIIKMRLSRKWSVEETLETPQLASRWSNNKVTKVN